MTQRNIANIVDRMVHLRTLRDGISRTRMALVQLDPLLEYGGAGTLEEADAALFKVMGRIDRQLEELRGYLDDKS